MVDKSVDRIDVWSNGLGTQSAAIAVLITQGKLPRPALSVTADTGREHAATFEYAERYIFPLLRDLGIPFAVADHSLATVDLYSNNGEVLIPAFLKDGTGKLPTFCSGEWKRRVVMRYLRSLGYGPDNPVNLWMGMSRDESQRMKNSDVQWMKHRYPLAMELRMSRYDCIQTVLNFGWPKPPRSRCFDCPQQGNPEWREIRENPAEWQQAIERDRQVTDSHEVYLHLSGVPLEAANLEEDEPQPRLFDGCDSGICEF